jgi:formylglycine-generating enzyme required for sulfatase activity
MLTEDTVLNHRYRVLRILSNKGGMGVVYLAEDQNFSNDPVIIKQSRFTIEYLRREFTSLSEPQLQQLSENLRRAFEREARLLRKLHHEHLPRVIDYFSIEGEGQFLVMDFVPGKDLGELLQERLQQNQGPLPVEQVLDWANQLLSALEYLHSQETPVIHRDIKPDNIKLMPNGKVMLLDFGLAKGAATGMSVVGSILKGFTRQYAPLEQMRGKGTDERSDLYSLAAALYHLLTGELPTDAVERVSETISGAPDPLRPAHELNPQVPAAVSAVLQQAAALNQKERPASATAMREALRQARQTVSDPAIIVHPAPPQEPPRPVPEEPETIVRPQEQIIIPAPQQPARRAFTEELGNGVSLEMIFIPKGTFQMGSPKGQGYDSEWPQHPVTVSSFFIGQYPVTQSQWQAVMGNNPSRFKGENNPVEQVSWEEAVNFCQKLSQQTGKAYRLPSEAEWEYAARAGTTTQYSFGDDEGLLEQYAWYNKNSQNRSHPVGERKPNDWGLYDLHGNVWEWCQDKWHQNYEDAPGDGRVWEDGGSDHRLLRGGSWGSFGFGCRSANRFNLAPGDRIIYFGFRVVVSARTQ